MFFTTTEAALTGASPGSETLPVSVARKSWARTGPHSKTISGRLLIALHNNRLPIPAAGRNQLLVVSCWPPLPTPFPGFPSIAIHLFTNNPLGGLVQVLVERVPDLLVLRP